MEQTGQQIFQFLSHYGYWIMLPLMIIEGPMVTLIAAIFAKLGAFNVWIVLLLSIVGDMIGDMILYALGYIFGLRFVKKFGKYLFINENLVLRMEKYFHQHGGVTIFIVKSTTGLSWATFITAGIVKMDFKKFIVNSFFGGIIWSSFLVAMGYFYGYLWKEIRNSIEWIGWIVAATALLSFVGIILYKRSRTQKMLKNN